MADEEPRRSGRATKGQHTKNADALDEPIPKSKPKPKTDGKKAKAAAPRSQSGASAESEEEDDQADAIVRCVCGDQRDNGPKMICCDKCEVWQHNRCLHLPQDDQYWENRDYFCEQCRPEEHQELLALMAKGEKPWIKWSKRGAKPPKSRPTDQKPTGKQDSAKTATPQPTQPATQPNTPTPAASAAASTPIAIPSEVAADPRTVQAEVKPTKKESIKSQPHSPLSEKRRHESISEKDGSSKKRRKSSAPKTENVEIQSGVVPDINALPQKQKAMAEKLRDTLAPLITAASDSRGYQLPDGETAQSIATRLALDVDRAALLRHGEPAGPESPFALQLRSIIFNTKKNTGLVDQLLSGSLKADDIAAMSPAEMASDEKQREYAAIREANEKQMVLTEETGPRFRKTHKGDELVENESYQPQERLQSPPPQPPPQSDEKPSMVQSPPKDGHATVELPEDVGRREPIAVDTTGGADGARRPSTNFDINSVFAQVRSPHNDQTSFIPRRQSSLQQPEKNTQVDADVDRLLKDEDGDIDMSSLADESIVWRGSIEMQHMEPCASVARFVAGGDFSKVIPWNQLLTTSLPIGGRIEEAKGDDYIRSLASTHSHDVAVLALSPVSSEGRAVMDTLYTYFHDRQRWGVIPVDKVGAIKDLYVIPIPEGGSNLPQFMDLLEHCTIETPRKENMLLLALVAKLPDIQPQLVQYPLMRDAAVHQTPVPAQTTNGANGPSPSPLTNPHGPSYSPVGPAFPPNPFTALSNNGYPAPPAPSMHPGHVAQAPTPPLDPASILGPYMASPVVQTILQNQYNTDILYNLKEVLDKVPAARDDLNILVQHIFQKNGAEPSSGNGHGN
ncbi:hypothetical protein BU23DRAFT_508127 [Bimuria novae-zelandiae CBS 107.79]|uniref:Transcription factor BYE1 n=1 Tax=Bimuria novae-zelandiae CBS 107.79 TaxID=1447943 RepID=A0A6A5VHL0_9PLEO|nr:hypothetical protein BU23DRAFT_508127 [Bimuria novae-zelandiae CBS 107.79]